jgi:hypothetical protein
MKLVLLTEAPKSGMFKSAKAIRRMIDKGQLVKGIHWWKRFPTGRVYVDLEACVDLLTREDVPRPRYMVERPTDHALQAAHEKAS